MGTIEKLAKAMLTALTEEDESGPGALSTSPKNHNEWTESKAEIKSAAIDLIERYASTLHYSTTRLGTDVDDVEAAKAQIDIARMRLASRTLRRMTPDYEPSEIVERNRAEAEMRARKASGGDIPLPDTTPHPTMGAGYRYLEIPEEGSFAVSAAPQPPDEPGFFGLSTAQDSFADPPAECPKPPEPEDGWGRGQDRPHAVSGEVTPANRQRTISMSHLPHVESGRINLVDLHPNF